MAEDIITEKRRFSRVNLNLPVDVQQGGSTWRQRLIDISLTGAATDQPAVWDAQYNEPFTLIVHLESGETLELHAYLQHVESDRLGFSVRHVDSSNFEMLQNLMHPHIDLATLEQELRQLEED